MAGEQHPDLDKLVREGVAAEMERLRREERKKKDPENAADFIERVAEAVEERIFKRFADDEEERETSPGGEGAGEGGSAIYEKFFGGQRRAG